jgi:hypothetical protein
MESVHTRPSQMNYNKTSTSPHLECKETPRGYDLESLESSTLQSNDRKSRVIVIIRYAIPDDSFKLLINVII